MNKRPTTIAAIAFSLIMVIGTAHAGISLLGHWDLLHDARTKAQQAKAASIAPYTFDGARIVMR
ncbi:MAG: hypothetical protein JNL25_13140 [Rhodospirillaceae bacterium]|nr:hypothetical protein [Rhodospirillaceae bacterium]